MPHARDGLRADADPVVFGDPNVLLQGDRLFLVGFPGELEDDPEPAISQGILSRVRTPDRWNRTVLQTDASIGGGQSGGAVVVGTGRVVDVSGLSFLDTIQRLASANGVTAEEFYGDPSP